MNTFCNLHSDVSRDDTPLVPLELSFPTLLAKATSLYSISWYRVTDPTPRSTLWYHSGRGSSLISDDICGRLIDGKRRRGFYLRAAISDCLLKYRHEKMLYSVFLTASPGSVLFSRSALIKRKDLCFSCLRLGLIRHRKSKKSHTFFSKSSRRFSRGDPSRR